MGRGFGNADNSAGSSRALPPLTMCVPTGRAIVLPPYQGSRATGNDRWTHSHTVRTAWSFRTTGYRSGDIPGFTPGTPRTPEVPHTEAERCLRRSRWFSLVGGRDVFLPHCPRCSRMPIVPTSDEVTIASFMKVLGTGSMGTVWLVADEADSAPVETRPPPELAESETASGAKSSASSDHLQTMKGAGADSFANIQYISAKIRQNSSERL